jgi:hypothetical protein
MSSDGPDYSDYEPPLNVVERIAAAVPSLCILIAIAAPVWAHLTDRADTKMGKWGTIPAVLLSIVLLHAAAVLGLRFKVLWSGNHYIGLVCSALCAGIWCLLIGSCVLSMRP